MVTCKKQVQAHRFKFWSKIERKYLNQKITKHPVVTGKKNGYVSYT